MESFVPHCKGHAVFLPIVRVSASKKHHGVICLLLHLYTFELCISATQDITNLCYPCERNWTKKFSGLFTPPLGPSSGTRADTSFAGEILCEPRMAWGIGLSFINIHLTFWDGFTIESYDSSFSLFLRCWEIVDCGWCWRYYFHGSVKLIAEGFEIFIPIPKA